MQSSVLSTRSPAPLTLKSNFAAKEASVRPVLRTAGPRRVSLQTTSVRGTALSRKQGAIVCQAKRGEPAAAAAVDVTPGTMQKAADYFAEDSRPIILFDGVCNMCNGGVNFMIDWDKEGRHRFAPLQSDCGRALLQRCGREPENLTSIVLVTDEKCHIRSDAILSIGRNLDMPMPVLATLAWFVPGFMRDVFYNMIATNRYNIAGKRKTMRCGDTSYNDRFVM